MIGKKLKVGFIGCGRIALQKHLPALQKIDTVEIMAFYNVQKEKAKFAHQHFGSENAKVYDHYHELLNDNSIDVVYICTPNQWHESMTIDALEKGKHVMCEKPMARTSFEAKKMLEAAKRNGKKLTIGYQNRFRQDTQYLHQICQRGELGDIYFAKAHAIRRHAVPTWGSFLDQEIQGGGSLIDVGSHSLDLVLWMMNNYKPKYVVGNIYSKLGRKESLANAWGAWDPAKNTVEDSAFGFITMENGATIILESSWALNTLDEGEAKVTLCGTQGGADMSDGLRINGEKDGQLYTLIPEPDYNKKRMNYISGSESELEARLWIESILMDKDPVVKPEEALVVTEIIEAIYESSKTGKPVYF